MRICEKCGTVYLSGNVCPECGTSNLKFVNLPPCCIEWLTKIYCKARVAKERNRYGYSYICEDERELEKLISDESGCLFDFETREGQNYVSGTKLCRADNVIIPATIGGVPIVGVDARAFEECQITRLRIEGNIKTIAPFAFSGAKKLSFVYFGASVSRVTEHAFSGCRELYELIVYEGTEVFGENAFENCSKMNYIVIPKSLVSIEKDAFTGCDALNEIYYMGDESDWEKLTIADGNDALTRAEVWFYCENKVTRPGKFWNFCDSKKESVQKRKPYREPVINYLSFISNDYLPSHGLEYVKTGGGYAVAGRGKNNETRIVIPPLYLGKKVVAISESAFDCDDVLKYIVIPETVQTIGKGAFYGCRNLSTVLMLGGVTRISSRAFSRCHSLQTVVVPETIKKIDRDAFEYLDFVEMFYMGTESGWKDVNVAYEGNEFLVVYHCIHFYSEERPARLNYAWHYSEKFRPVKWESKYKPVEGTIMRKSERTGGEVLVFPFNPLHDLPHEEEVSGNGNEDKLSRGLTYQRSSKKCCVVSGRGTNTDSEIVIPSVFNGLKVEGVGDGAFLGCKDIISVTVPDGAEYVGTEAFKGCSNLRELILPDTVSTIGNFAFESSGLYNFKMPRYCTYNVGEGILKNCKKLRTVDFWGMLCFISEEMFRGCSALRSVIFPWFCHSLRARAFDGCTSLKTIYFARDQGSYQSMKIDEEGNSPFLEADIYYYSLKKPNAEGKFWHYSEKGKLLLW